MCIVNGLESVIIILICSTSWCMGTLMLECVNDRQVRLTAHRGIHINGAHDAITQLLIHDGFDALTIVGHSFSHSARDKNVGRQSSISRLLTDSLAQHLVRLGTSRGYANSIVWTAVTDYFGSRIKPQMLSFVGLLSLALCNTPLMQHG